MPSHPSKCNILSILYIHICSTALQAVMDRMDQMERSNQQMERSMEELRLENRRAMNIGPEMDQEIDTNVYQ